MPIYEYACTSCGEHLEVAQSFSDDPLTTCPNCGGSLRKVFGSIGIVLKGSGFYKTDNRRNGSAGQGGTKPGEGSEPTKETTKEAAKSEPAASASPAAPASTSPSPGGKGSAAGNGGASSGAKAATS